MRERTYTITWMRTTGKPEHLVCTGLNARTALARLMGALDYSGPIIIHKIQPEENTTMHDPVKAGQAADDIIASEIARQDAMWGRANERADTRHGELLQAGLAQAQATWLRRDGQTAFDTPPPCYPVDWSGFRDYGSDVANLAVAAAFIRQEMKRLIDNGAPTIRTSRNPAVQPYSGDQPAVQL